VQFNTPVLKDGLLFGLSDKGVFFCLDAKTGKTDWMDTTKRGGNFASILDAGSVILALPSTSELIAFKPSDKAYTEVARIKVAETPTYAHPVIAGNRVFVRDAQNIALETID
jgi:outer membrane protein assembly factor BamB